ncbi:MAG: peroxide stress protein YaaA [Myxococcota bacterium]
MICVISPAKKMSVQFSPTLGLSQPIFTDDAQVLLSAAREKSVEDLQGLMHISEKLAVLNHERFQAMQLNDSTVQHAAVSLFAGDTFVGLDAKSWDEAQLEYAQSHLRILSGLFGLLRPLDRISPYRLEMGTKFQNSRGKDLYSFWGNQLSKALNEIMGQDPILVNLASQEYFKAIDQASLDATVVTPQFKEWRNGKLKIISFSAKRARGMMAKFIVQNKLKSIDQIKHFSEAGYQFSPEHSSNNSLVFARDAV